MKYFRFSAEGDSVYVTAPNEFDARACFNAVIGEVPDSLLTVTEILECDLPGGEVWL